MEKVTAAAHANIAFIKYWGKRNDRLNLPAVGSISLTLNELKTVTSVRFSEELESDTLVLNGLKAPERQSRRVSRFFDLIRSQSGKVSRAEIISENNFPTGAGLASSASAFASLALAGSKAAGMDLTDRELSVLARRGSGSAARSIFGGFVEMKMGEDASGSSDYAIPLDVELPFNLRIMILITEETEKKTGSTEGMQQTRDTSPFYTSWVRSAEDDLTEMRSALRQGDFAKIGELAEYSCLKMHGLALSARPGLIYWNPTTVSLMQQIRELRANGTPVYFTIDAGPQVKAICLAEDAEQISAALSETEGLKKIIVASPGPGAKVIGDK